MPAVPSAAQAATAAPADPSWETWASLVAPWAGPLLAALAADGLPAPDDVGCDLAVAGRVVGAAELCWSARRVCVALPDQLAAGARSALQRDGWHVVLADPSQPAAAVAAVRQTLAAGVARSPGAEGR
jgi:hypothetical protein